MRRFLLPPLVAIASFALACGPGRGALTTRPAPPLVVAPLALDPEVSPVSFRWLSPQTVLVSQKAGTRALAGFGNYVSRTAGKSARARLEVWDDEEAWKRSTGGSENGEELSHKRAEYWKEPSPEPVDRYVVFGRTGGVVYQRDFLAWPLSELD